MGSAARTVNDEMEITPAYVLVLVKTNVKAHPKALLRLNITPSIVSYHTY
jgi:hypothetical protein